MFHSVAYLLYEIPVDSLLDVAPIRHEMTVDPQWNVVLYHTGTMAYPTLGKPITKELKRTLNIKNKTIVEMNLDVAQLVIN
ncbi:hypothetical protein SporoP17a_13595 [Sporosarcina ureae]|nr:hypothetical protein SporoP17a_13595 [Sporosarcina ureae]